MTGVDLRALLEAATPTPWKVKKSRSRIAIDSPPSLSVCEISGTIDAPRVDEDAALIVAAVNSLPHLLDDRKIATEALRAVVAILGPEVPQHGCEGCEAEMGEALRLARAALSALDEQEPQ